MRKTRPDDKLGNLDDGQQLKLMELLMTPGLSYQDVRELIVKSPPDGFGFFVSVSALSRFYQQNVAPYLLAKRQRAVSASNAVAEEAQKHPGRFDQATIDALKQKAFELSISPHVNPKDVKAIFALVLKARDQDLDERKIILLEKKAAQAEQAEQVLRSEQTPEDKERSMRAIFGMS